MKRAILSRLFGGAVLAAASLGAATGAVANDEVTLNLNWFQLADHSPYYLAKKRGYYEEEGIDLTIVRGYGSSDTVQKIDLGAAEFGVADTPTVITGISKGAELKILGIVFDAPNNGVFSPKSAGIEKPTDLNGKKIAAPPGDAHLIIWPAFAEQNGIDTDTVTMVNVKPEGKQAIVVGGDVDGAFDAYTGWYLWEAALGEGNVNFLAWKDYGLPLYGQSIMARTDFIDANPDLVKRFLRASYRGWHDTAAEPDAAIEAMAEEVEGFDTVVYRKNLDLILDLVITERSHEHGLGWILSDRMQGTIDLTAMGGVLDREVTPEEVFTNEFNSKVMPPE